MQEKDNSENLDSAEGLEKVAQEKISKPKEKPIYFLEYEIKETLATITSPRDKALFALLYATGSRISEVVGVIRCTDITVDRDNCIEVNITTLKARKTHQRTVIIPPYEQWLIEPILNWKSILESGSWGPARLMFPITRQWAWQLCKGYFGTHPHSHRHSRATWAGKKGLNVFELQQMFGWTNMSSASGYVRANAEDVKRKIVKEF